MEETQVEAMVDILLVLELMVIMEQALHLVQVEMVMY